MRIFRFIRTISIFLVFSFLSINLSGQDKVRSTEEKLNSLVNEIPALNQRITISVSNITVNEFLRGIANSSGLNINVDPGISVAVVNNFNDVRVLDILLFLVSEYNLDISVIGNIINVFKTPVIDSTPKPKTILYDTINDRLTLNYQKQNLQMVVKEITEVTGKNVVLSPGLEGIQVAGYIQAMPFENAIEMFAYSNGLYLEKTKDNFFVLAKENQIASEPVANTRTRTRPTETGRPKNGGTDIDVRSYDSIRIYAVNAPVEPIIKEVSEKLGISYYISSPVAGNTTLDISGVDYDKFLALILQGTQTSYICQNNVYIFTGAGNTNIREYRIVKLRYRTVNKLLDVFPESMKTGIELSEMTEMNSILIGGPSARVNEVGDFIRQIDKAVPVILIEVMIVYFSDSYSVSTGIEAGLTDEAIETTGKVFPGVDIQVGSETINKVLNGFNGFSSLNLGKVKSNFYMSLQAMESQGLVDIASTPKLSTMNGHEANMSIGNTEYYLEQSTNIYGTQDPQLMRTDMYKSVDAELSIKITPIVSGDNQITMDIEVNQSDFTSRISDYAPPGKTTRTFKSLVRVQDQETILLGGLEEKRKSDTSKGVPLLSRIPVLKWIFSSRNKINEKTRLNVFIKPTIIN